MQQSSEQPKKAPRKHVTTACVPCRESKIRCDGATPNCQNCQKKGRECKYQHGDDKRKVSLRAATELFSARIDQLCQFIYDHGLEPPPMQPEAEQGMNRVLDTLQIPRGVVRRPGSNNENASTSRLDAFSSSAKAPDRNSAMPLGRRGEADPGALRENSAPHSAMRAEPRSTNGLASGPSTLDFSLPTAECLDNIYANMHSPSNSSAERERFMGADSHSADYLDSANSGAQMANRFNDEYFDSDSDDEAEKEVIEQLSSRIGTLKIAGDGHLRYYGPTSNLNLIDVLPATEHRPGPDTRSVRHDGQELLNYLRIGQPVDPALEDHLIELYFTWQNPSSYVVDREMYMAARSKWRENLDDTPFYSEVLTNAMCALGAAFEARYHPTFITFPKSLSEFFADRAKTLLEIELDSPCVATVQALVILSSHEAASNRDARGWLYSGMSMRLAFDLGLHVDMTPYVQKESMNATEAEVRRVAFWGSYVADHFWGFYLGRPFRMNAGDISVLKPASDLSRAKEETWYPYGMADAHSRGLSQGLKNPSELISRQFAVLWEMISPLGHILYGCADIAKHDLQRLNYKVTEDLFAWKENLPSSLQVDLDNDSVPVLPHLLMLHMQYHQIVIFVHRPWLSKTYIQPQNPKQGPGYLHARRMCIESATAVARLLRLYEKHYTFRRINNQVVAIIFTAALMLIFVTISTSSQSPGRSRGDDRATMVAHLNVCFRALDELGQSFENAKRTRDFLVTLQRRWQNHFRKSGAKRLMSTSNPSPGGEDATRDSDASSRKKKSRLLGASTRDHQRVTSAPPPMSAPSATRGVATTHPPPPPPPPPPNIDLESIDLNWAPSSSELKFLSDNLGAPLLHQGNTAYVDDNMLSNLPEIGASWWDSPSSNSNSFGRSF
ncbi:hypothetical protein VTN77DRAFT_6402 [Rasamsonia byssochlamydoides]|uniref:uncharacterized protein n=1 Tax=Rasamsonia byssochlamydoides TaxID=89139 RepID=UPI003743631F